MTTNSAFKIQDADEVKRGIATRKQKKEHRKKQRQALLQWAYDPFK